MCVAYANGTEGPKQPGPEHAGLPGASFTRRSVFGRDKALCRTLEQSPFVRGHPRWLHEIIAMKDAEEKCEIQAVYEALRESHIDFSHWLLEMVCCAITSDREEEP